MKLSLNLNDYVWIRVSEEALASLRNRRVMLFGDGKRGEAMTVRFHDPCAPKPNCWFKIQIHALMQDYGPLIVASLSPIVNNEIRVDDPTKENQL